MFHTKFFYRFLFVFLFLVSLLSACSFGDPLAHLPKLPDGTVLENFIPADPDMVLTYFPDDEEQSQLFSKHVSEVTQGDSEKLMNMFLGMFPQNRAFTILAPIYLRQSFPKSLFTSWNEKGTEEFLMVSVLENPDTFKNLLPENEDSFAVLFHENILLVASKKEFLSPSIDHSFLQNPNYQNFLKKLPNHFDGYAYIKDEPATSPSFLVYGAEDDGISVSSYQQKQSYAATNLTEKIPAKNMMLGAEGTDLSSIVALELEILKNTPFLQSLYGDNPLKGLEEKFGLSYEQDIKPFLQKNFAWVIEDQGKILPALSLWVDASGNPIGAEKVARKIDEALSTFITVADVGLAAAVSPFERKTIDFNGSPLHQIIFTPKNFPQEKRKIPLFENLDETWGFTYGLTKDNLFLLSTRSEFPTNTPGQAKAKTWDDQDLYRELRSHVRGYSKTDHFYFETKPFLDWSSGIIELGQDSANLSAQEKEAFEVLQKHLSPIQGGIGGTKIKGDLAETKIFVKIGK